MSSNAAAIGADKAPDGANGDASREPPSKRRRVALACNACMYTVSRSGINIGADPDGFQL